MFLCVRLKFFTRNSRFYSVIKYAPRHIQVYTTSPFYPSPSTRIAYSSSGCTWIEKISECVNKLYQYREITEFQRIRSKTFLSVCFNIFRERKSIKFAAVYRALSVLMCGKLPAFGYYIKIRFLLYDVLSFVPPPKIILKRR